MKLNLGSGTTKFDGFINVDDDPLTNPDFVVDLELGKLPFETDTVEEIKAHHILEHIGDGYIPLIQEIYRVCKHGALIDIIVPHHNHEVFYGDPTHKRPITVNGMYLFSKKFCENLNNSPNATSRLAYKYGVDFDVVSYAFDYDPFYQNLVDSINDRKNKNQISEEEQFLFQRLMREGNNVAIQTKIKLKVVKQ
jgi:SAM-dependent methyltransferase